MSVQAAAAQPALNTPVIDSSGPLQKAGGEGPTTFDELESVSRGTAAKKAVEKAEEHQAEKDAGKSAPKTSQKEAKSKDKPEETKADKPEQEGKIDTESVEKAVAKLLKLKAKDSEYEVPADALVTVKVDGKPEQVSIQEAINRYSQQKHLDEVYRKYKTERTMFDQERGRMNQVLSKAQEMLVKNQDLEGFIEWMGEAYGEDGTKWYQDAMSKLTAQMQEWSTLTPEERRIKELERENARFKQRKQESAQQHKQKQEYGKFVQTVEAQMSTAGITKQDMVNAYDDLKSLGYKSEQISPESLISYHKNMQVINTVETSLKEARPGQEIEAEKVEEIARLAIQTKATPAEIQEVVKQLYAEEAPERKLARKMAKSERANRGSSQPKNPGKDPMFFDDIV